MVSGCEPTATARSPVELTSTLTYLNAQSTSTASNTLTIDGYTEPGAHANTDPTVSNALPGITISGVGVSCGSNLSTLS